VNFKIGWAFSILIGSFFALINLIFEMPYNKWLETHISESFSIFLCILFFICFLILAIPRRNIYLNYVTGTIFILIAIGWKGILRKAFSINIIIFFVSVAIYFILRIFLYIRRNSGKNYGHPESADQNRHGISGESPPQGKE
jgi:hypothetical protein